MGRDKILQHTQAFSKIRLNGCLNDFAGRLGHQPPHTRQLSHLVLTASGAGIGHHINRIQAFSQNLLAFLILDQVAS